MKILFSAPGPSPWYLRLPGAVINTKEGQWTWDSYDDNKRSGICRLISPNKQSVLFLDFQCYVMFLPYDRILIWYESGRDNNEKSFIPKIVFTILNIHNLKKFSNHKDAAKKLREEKLYILYNGDSASTFIFNSTIDEGIYPIDAPLEFKELEEILVLADYGPTKYISNYYDKMFRAIFSFRFNLNEVEVFPQKWFNEGSYDFGYQWITRVARNKETGRIVGEGIRLGNFELDSSSTQIEKWLEQDAFYHPERGL
jgi:hypothetical protein